MSDQARAMTNQALSLAGVAQFALYAHELASGGRDSQARFERATRAICCTDPDTALDVFGDRASLADGIRYLRVQLSGQRPDAKGAAIARYIGQILKLSGKLLADEQALGRIRGAIDRVQLNENADAANLFNTAYRETISSMKPRIMLQGDRTHLENESIQRRIRTYLLAALRCGVMWRQCGGGFISLFFRRKALLAALD